MSGGGDTPEPQTLWALETESGKFISGYFQNGVLYANTDEGSSALWELDENGVVIGNISYSVNERAPILTRINEHFGTSFTGWSDNEIALQLGDNLPSWAAYEKIILPEIKIKMNMPGSTTLFAMGLIKGSLFSLIGNSNNELYKVKDTGEIDSTSGSADSFAESYCKPKLISAGYGIEETQIQETSYNIGDYVSNWDEYLLIE